MAFFRRNRRKTRKSFRSYRKYKGKNGKRLIKAPKSSGFAPLGYTQAARLRYCEEITLDPAMGVANDYVFSANGMFDPNISGVGHQPYGFDQLMVMYDHYTVVGSKCTITMAPQVTACSYVGIKLEDNASTYAGTATEVLLEQPATSLKANMSFTAGSVKKVFKCFSAKKFFTKKFPVSADQYSGSNAANPIDQAYYHVLLAPFTNTENLTAQTIHVQIDYLAVFSEPRVLPRS